MKVSANLVYFQAYNSLPAIIRVGFDNWFSLASKVANWFEMEANLYDEKQLTVDFFKDWLSSIVANLGLISQPQMQDAIDTFIEACRPQVRHFNGPQSKVSSSTVLRTIVDRETFERFVERILYSVTIDHSEEDVLLLWNLLSDEEKLSLLNKVELFEPNSKSHIWVFFSNNAAYHGLSEDPLSNRTANECCHMLGLPASWYSYGLGKQLFKLAFRLPEDVVSYVPTVIDSNATGWNTYFIPARHSFPAPWGVTRPLNSPRESDGVPEVVFPGGNRVSFTSIPDNIGVRTT